MPLARMLKKSILFYQARKVWRKPKKASILIYDRNGADFFLQYISSNDTEILEVRGESVNLHLLLRCFLAFDFLAQSYIDRYISAVDPSVVLTFIDNHLRFYQLKTANPKITTVFVQNAWRGIMNDIFGNPGMHRAEERYRVDYMLTLGPAIGEKYHEYIDGQVIPIGSMRCNHWSIEASTDRRTLVFISQYLPLVMEPGQQSVGTIDGRTVTWYEFYEAERMVVRYLAAYCRDRGLMFQICGRTETASDEYRFFAEAIGHEDWEFRPRAEPQVSYGLIDRAAYVVGIDSTLAYESLARGNRTGVFSIRGELLNDPGTRFGWPARLPDTGPFWTNHADETEFDRILSYLGNASNDEWRESLHDHVPELIDYDFGNSRFISLMNEIQSSSKQGRRSDVR